MRDRAGLVIDAVTVGYRRRPPVLTSVSAHLVPGRMVALLGPNGSGKSTLLHAALGLVPLRAGSVTLHGRPLSEVQRTSVGFCADDLPLPALLTGLEFLRFSAAARGRVLEDAAASSLFSAMSMSGVERRLIREFSHGMKRKLVVLANILHDPELLILDEPFRGLDIEAHEILRSVLRTAVARGAIVLSPPMTCR